MWLKEKRIFIVEDNTINRSVYQMILRAQGAWLEFDRWGREAVPRLDGFKPDLIIIDLMLPGGLTGFDVFNEIRAHPEYAQVPVVAVSASEPSVALPRCQQAGFSGFIAKPVDEALLPEQLAKIIAGEQVWYVNEQYGGDERRRRP